MHSSYYRSIQVAINHKMRLTNKPTVGIPNKAHQGSNFATYLDLFPFLQF